MHKHEVLLTDMSRCQPGEALSSDARHGHWQLVPFETDEVSGTMVWARPETEAPEITLPLGVRGWHAIYLGFAGWTWAGNPRLGVKLSGDPCMVQVESDTDLRYLEEGFWKIADLTGQDLVIAQQTRAEARPASLAYVRLVALGEDAVRRYKDRSGSRRLIAMRDGHGFSRSAEEIRGEIEPYRDTDFGKLFLETWHGDRSNYPAEVGVPFGQDVEDFPKPIYRVMAECAQGMREQGVDTLRVSLDHAHEMGLELYAGMRMGFFGVCPPAQMLESPFFREHAELRCRDWDDTQVSHLSYAFPEVRQYVLGLLGDVARYDIDGVNLIFRRGQPYVLYEKPLVDGFKKRAGIDPRKLGEKDERWRWYEREFIPKALWCVSTSFYPPGEELFKQRCTHADELSLPVQNWLRYRAERVTEFLRRLRELLMRIGRGQKVSAVVFGNEADNLFWGLDVEAWVKEGLVDILIPYDSPDWLWPELSRNDMRFFESMTEGSGCKVYPNVMPRRMGAEEYLKKAANAYKEGADGLAFWDASARHTLLSQWRAIRDLGHKAELAEWLETGRLAPKLVQLKRLGGYTVDRYHPASGG